MGGKGFRVYVFVVRFVALKLMGSSDLLPVGAFKIMKSKAN